MNRQKHSERLPKCQRHPVVHLRDQWCPTCVEERDHDAELRRIAGALGLPWPSTVDEIVKLIEAWEVSST